jgi:bacterioferritin-associated ferredoxin
MHAAGTVCLCEDVSVGDLKRAWAEGYRSSELLKRYTTATMGPCQGAMCGRHLAALAAGPTPHHSPPPPPAPCRINKNQPPRQQSKTV